MTSSPTQVKALRGARGTHRLLRLSAIGVMLVAGAGLTSGCAVKSMQEATKLADDQREMAISYTKEISSRQDMVHGRPVLREMHKLWVDTTPVEINTKSLGGRPTALDCPITFNPRSPVTLSEFARLASSSCGVAIHIADNVTPALMGTLKGTNAIEVDKSALPSPVLGGGNVSADFGGTYGSGAGDLITGITWINRPLSGLLDLVSSHLGLGWRFDTNTQSVRIFYTDTQVFQLYAIPGTMKMGSKVKSGADESTTASSSGGGAGTQSRSGSFSSEGSSQSTEVSFSTDVMADVEKSLKAMITPGLGRLAVAQSTGTITVTDRPEVLRRIEAYIDEENRQLTRQVVLNVKVLSVQLTEDHTLGINWNAVYESMGRFSAGFGGALAAGPANFGNVKIINSNSNWNGTQAFIDALSAQGRVSTLTSPSITTVNLRPAPILVGKQTTYLAEVSTTSIAGDVSGSNSTQSMTPGTVTTGFNMTLLPYLMEGSEMLLQYNVNLSALIKMNEIGGKDGNKIQMPDVDNRIFSQTVRLRSGQTLVISGFDQSITSGTARGVGDPDFWLLGGGKSTSSTRDVIVVLITPIVTD